MNLVYPACLLGGILIGVPVTVLLSAVYDRRKTNVVDLELERAQRRHPSNVTPLVRKNGVKVLPYRRWPA